MFIIFKFIDDVWKCFKLVCDEQENLISGWASCSSCFASLRTHNQKDTNIWDTHRALRHSIV